MARSWTKETSGAGAGSTSADEGQAKAPGARIGAAFLLGEEIHDQGAAARLELGAQALAGLVPERELAPRNAGAK